MRVNEAEELSFLGLFLQTGACAKEHSLSPSCTCCSCRAFGSFMADIQFKKIGGKNLSLKIWVLDSGLRVN